MASSSSSSASSASALAEINSELAAIEFQVEELQRRKKHLVDKKKRLAEENDKKSRERLQSKDWDGKAFPWSAALDAELSSSFHLNTYRPHQLSTMNAFLSGHDVFLIMPTGGGKSLCYQLPALASPGLTLVVSPLVSLMEDQVMAMERVKKGAAKMFNASTTRQEGNDIMKAMVEKNSPLKLLYVTPEKLAKSKRFMTKLQASYKAGVFCRLAIDEVHCCSQWGHDFRPDYKFLGVMKSLFPKVPVIGLTATSTSRVTADCQKLLNLKNCLVFKAPFNRPNLFYEVRQKPESAEESVAALADMLSNEFSGQSGIIYTLTVKEVDTLAKNLREAGLRVAPYHAQLEPESRSRVHRQWLTGEYQAVVATIAFGMGIDKPDVRFVIHQTISKSMENFYQESGRAGRDDQLAKCIAFYRFSDVSKISTMVFTDQTGLEKLYGMVAYGTDFNRCRRSIIADHFGEAWDTADCNEMCDNCSSAPKHEEMKEVFLADYVDALRKILSQAACGDGKMTGLKLVNALLGKGEGKFRIADWSPPKEMTKSRAELIVAHLLMEGFLKGWNSPILLNSG